MIDVGNSVQNPFDTLLDAAVDAIIVIDKLGSIQVVNPAVTRLFGYERAELLGNNVKMLMPVANSEHHDDYLRHYLKTGERKIIGIGRETIGQKKDLSCFPIYLSVGHSEDHMGTRFIGIIRDLTRQQQKEEEIARTESEVRQLRDRLTHVARISTLGEMVTGIAHEVNQPLTAIATYAHGCSRMIKAGGLDDSTELLEVLDKISHQAERAARVITQIRHFSKKSKTIYEPCNCNELITEVVALAEVYAAELDVVIALQLAQSLSRVMVDAIQVQQVILNLINNAIESMVDSSGDKIVTLQSRMLGKDTVEVSVSDLGTGMDKGVEEKVFDAFFTTKVDGLGIGLSTCQSLITAQGGKMNFYRNPNQGCTFHFTLPTVIGE